MGYDGVRIALAASKGEKVEANVDTGANLVTKANLNDPSIQALVHPKVN
jgi:ribose transport system substrate-binding protein